MSDIGKVHAEVGLDLGEKSGEEEEILGIKNTVLQGQQTVRAMAITESDLKRTAEDLENIRKQIQSVAGVKKHEGESGYPEYKKAILQLVGEGALILDEEMTTQLQQESADNIGGVYILDEDEVLVSIPNGVAAQLVRKRLFVAIGGKEVNYSPTEKFSFTGLGVEGVFFRVDGERAIESKLAESLGRSQLKKGEAQKAYEIVKVKKPFRRRIWEMDVVDTPDGVKPKFIVGSPKNGGRLVDAVDEFGEKTGFEHRYEPQRHIEGRGYELGNGRIASESQKINDGKLWLVVKRDWIKSKGK